MDQSLSYLTGFFGVRESSWGTSVTQWRQYCRSVQVIVSAIDCLFLILDRQLSKASSNATELANNCLGGLSSTIISVTALKATRLNRQIYCKNKQIMERAVAHGKCGNAAKEQTIKCWVNMIDVFVHLKNAPTADKIPGICWSVNDINSLTEIFVNHCLSTVLSTNGETVRSTRWGTTLRDFVAKITSNSWPTP